MEPSKLQSPETLEFVSPIDTLPQDIHLQSVQRDSVGYATPARPTGNLDLFQDLSSRVPGLHDLSSGARAATNAEHKMTFLKACRVYPKAMAWSALASSTIIMEGFDLTLVNSFLASPAFQNSYGSLASTVTGHQIPLAWQSGLSNAAVSGEILGLFLNGYCTDRFGYHRTMVGALIWLSLSLFLFFFSINVQMLLAAQILCGLSWGIFQTMSTAYAAEVVPATLRPYLTSNINMCWLLGQLCGVGVVYAFVNSQSEWAYRIPFGLQWAFVIPILLGMIFAPESPWWLVRHGRFDEAKESLRRLTSPGSEDNFNVDETILMMRHTSEVEKHLNGSGLSYLDCFKGTSLRRTEIACVVWITQSLSGSVLTGYAAYFFVQAGLPVTHAFHVAVGMYGAGIVGGILSWIWLRRFGRRKLYLAGLSISFIILLGAGGISLMTKRKTVSWVLGSFVIAQTFCYDNTIGPVCYVLVAEIPSTRLRIRTIVLARVAYNICSIVVNIITLHMLNPTSWDWKGKSCFFFAGTTFCCLSWSYFRLPEPRGLTYLELDILFDKKASARKFEQFQKKLASSGYFSLAPVARPESLWWGYS
ncbi:hypothetical protein BDV26DRAFT_287761 [Aspergillus bertholletiae]|uniref:Major facilitator superfamily (MFS) profile domain-containing protein n=1 Tax=Aspergillus bertholletiae TaxID=1226010 RepID=A0A5N7BNA3_9EURO|nr:hypothetical protein BDV26DRAFT_287761 [Aspergillus bertholletiae]